MPGGRECRELTSSRVCRFHRLIPPYLLILCVLSDCPQNDLIEVGFVFRAGKPPNWRTLERKSRRSTRLSTPCRSPSLPFLACCEPRTSPTLCSSISPSVKRQRHSSTPAPRTYGSSISTTSRHWRCGTSAKVSWVISTLTSAWLRWRWGWEQRSPSSPAYVPLLNFSATLGHFLMTPS